MTILVVFEQLFMFSCVLNVQNVYKTPMNV